jgi:hypothetical protein
MWVRVRCARRLGNVALRTSILSPHPNVMCPGSKIIVRMRFADSEADIFCYLLITRTRNIFSCVQFGRRPQTP